MWTLLLDGLVAGLLVVTIALAMILNRRFASLRRDRLEFQGLADEFHAAVGRAEDSVGRLKATAAGLESENRNALSHEEDLRQLIERADAAADRLEAAVRGARARPAAALRHAGAALKPGTRVEDAGHGLEAEIVAHASARSAAENDLLQAMRFKR